MTITSITIGREQIASVIQDWLNTHVLRSPQTVTSYEIDDGTVTIALAPHPEPVEGPLAPPAPIAEPVEAPDEQQEEPAAHQAAPKSARAMPRRKLTDADISAITIHRHTSTPAELARALGVAKTAVQKWLDENHTD